MNFSDFITHHGKRVNKEHFIHLIQISKTDGIISPAELELLHKEGKKFGLTEPEVDKLVKNEDKHHYIAPYSLMEKFDHLYNVAGMILADDVVTDSEKRMIRRFAIEAGFDDTVIDNIINLLLDGVKSGVDEDRLFKEFKKKIL